MARTAIILFAMLAFSSAAIGAEEWFGELNHEEIIAETVFVGLAVLDWNQTLQIAKHPDEYSETNFIIGEHPSEGRVNILMPAGIVLHALVTYALPRKYRSFWQYVWIGEEAACVYQNWRTGLTVRF